METPLPQASALAGWLERSAFYEERGGSRSYESNRFYHRLLRERYCFLVPPGAKALEIGCGLGDLLAAVGPARGVGIDFSGKTIALARQRHPEIEFHVGDAGGWGIEEKFDYILLSDLINDLADVQSVFEKLQSVPHSDTRLVLNFLNTLWRPFLGMAEICGGKAPSPPQNWLSTDDVVNLLQLTGWETVKVEQRILWPINTPVIGNLLNRWLAPILSHLCLTIFIVARPKTAAPQEQQHRCSVVVPVRNEAGNIEAVVQRTPRLGLGTELIFVEGHSSDDTWSEIQRVARAYPEAGIKALQQQGRGKGDAVREGFSAASGELLFILDGDLTVAPEELPKFYEIMRKGSAEFANGARLVYPMQQEAMRFLNMIANKLFGLAFSWLLGQRIKDTLCGTKVLWRRSYESIAKGRECFGDLDPFGDFDLLFGAARLNLRIADVPVRYAARTYGETNIRRWQHGWLLLRMVLLAARKLKFR